MHVELVDTEIKQKKKDIKARIFLLVDLREIFFRFRVGGTKKKALKMISERKSSENDQLTGHFQSFFFRAFFLYLQKKTVKLVR